MKTYEKITLKRGNNWSTGLYRIISETSVHLFVKEVDLRGKDKEYYTPKENLLVQSVYMFNKDIIKKRVKMTVNKKHNGLVPMKV